MEIAAVRAIAELAQAEQSERVAAAYVGEKLSFGAEYLIPKPFDPRLMMKIAPAVAKAAEESGVASRPIKDMDAYRDKLQNFVYASGTTMKPIFEAARRAQKKRVAYCEGEEERVLRAAQIVVDEGIARPTLIGRPAVIAQRIEKFGLRLKEELDYDIVNVEQDHRYRDFWQTYHRMTERKGQTVQTAKIEMRRRLTLIGAMLLHKDEVDGMICGTWGTTLIHLHYIDQVIGKRPGGCESTPQDVPVYACMNGLLLPDRQVFLVDTHVNYDRNHDHGGRGNDALRPEAEGGAAVAFQLRHQQRAQRHQDAQDARPAARAGALARSRRRNARRRGAGQQAARGRHATQRAGGRRQPVGFSEHRRSQYFVQPAQDGGRWKYRDRPGLAGCGQTCAHSHGQRDCSPHREHDSLDSGRRERAEIGHLTRVAANLSCHHRPSRLLKLWAVACYFRQRGAHSRA
jgi:hypothetical protein